MEELYNNYGNTYDQHYYDFYTNSKQPYDPYVVNKVDQYTRYEKQPDPNALRNNFVPMH